MTAIFLTGAHEKKISLIKCISYNMCLDLADNKLDTAVFYLSPSLGSECEKNVIYISFQKIKI